MPRCYTLALAAALLCSHSEAVRRKTKQQSQRNDDTVAPAADKFIKGIPIYHYGAVPSIMSAARDWVVYLNAETDAAVDRFCKKGGASRCATQGYPSYGGVPFVKVKASEEELEELLDNESSAVEFLEPNMPLWAIPDLPDADVTAQALSVQSNIPWGLKRIGTPKRSNTGKGVHVYVLDTGIRSSHSDFGGRAIPAIDVTTKAMPDRPYECKGNLKCAGDSQGHGTHCAGSVAGKKYGVAPDAMVHAVKVLGDDGSGSNAGVMAGLDWVARSGQRPAVVSMSLGGPGVAYAMRRAVQTAVKSGVTVVVASGNENSDACTFSPAFVPEAIGVGATTSQDKRASFSNFGACVDIWAPGASIISAGHRSDTDTATQSGTSMACPHVAGAAALQLEMQPGASPKQVRDALIRNAEKKKISDLKQDDTNLFLSVVGSASPGMRTKSIGGGCPDHAASELPDENGDCACAEGTSCSEGGFSLGCAYSGTRSWGFKKSWKFFSPKCTRCQCVWSPLR